MAELQPNSVDIEKWLKLIRADEVGPVTFAKLIKHFGSVDAALGASVSELAKIDGIGLSTLENNLDFYLCAFTDSVLRFKNHFRIGI